MKKEVKVICVAQVAGVFGSASVSGQRVGQVEKGQELVRIASQGDWTEIKSPPGWVLTEHLVQVDEPEPDEYTV
ncbi:MAG: hypothetical protein KBA03_00700 [Anaerolineaceae bacterium]|nr:hypothetical protein [Anaerolineaceae bacterium]